MGLFSYYHDGCIHRNSSKLFTRLEVQYTLNLTYSFDVPSKSGKPATSSGSTLKARSTQAPIPISKSTLLIVLKMTLAMRTRLIASVHGQETGTPCPSPSKPSSNQQPLLVHSCWNSWMKTRTSEDDAHLFMLPQLFPLVALSALS